MLGMMQYYRSGLAAGTRNPTDRPVLGYWTFPRRVISRTGSFLDWTFPKQDISGVTQQDVSPIWTYRPWADSFCSTVTRTNQLHYRSTAVLTYISHCEELQAEVAPFLRKYAIYISFSCHIILLSRHTVLYFTRFTTSQSAARSWHATAPLQLSRYYCT